MSIINNTPLEWTETTLGEVIMIIGGGTPRTSIKEYWNGTIPWLSVVDFNNDNRWVSEADKHITELGLKKSSTKLLNVGDVIISARGTVGAMSQLKKKMAFNQSCYGIRGVENISDINFIFYLLKFNLKQISRNTYGAVFDTITTKTFDIINVKLPPLKEQKSIATILTAFDDKIELLQTQNNTLGATAQVIFKEWFGKYQIGEELPEGWKVDTLDALSEEITRGFTSSYVENSNLINLNQKVNKGSFLDKKHFKYYDENTHVPPNKFIKKHDILLNSLGEGTLGRVHLYCEETDNVVADQHISILRFKNGLAFYIYQNLISDEGQFRLLNEISGSTGMTMLNISKVRDFEIVVPPPELLDAFNCLLITFYEKIENNNAQIESLQLTRDVLLPKLISGEVCVNDFKD